jgi:ectoine hydroxylase-related dioxygenase (phytanoyl-CoA dioxygenase family)
VRIANWVVKDPSLGDTTVPLHQDWSFVDERRHRTMNLWFPLTDVDEQNGCLEVVAGSHHVSTDHRAHTDQCRFDNLAPQLRQGYTTFVPMKAGQALVYDSALLHCSAHNTSLQRRIAVNTLLVPQGVTTLHPYRISPKQVELFGVDDEFFLRHVPGVRPQGAATIGKAQSSVKQHGAEVLGLLGRN